MLWLTSDPSGAAAYVDGRFVGQTLIAVTKLTDGDHRVRLVRAGYLEHSRIVNVRGSATVTFGARLTARTQGGQAPAFRIVVIAGENAVNIIQQKTSVAPVVEVRDRNDLPVAGATVIFTIGGGNAATFTGAARTVTVTTDALGRAATTAITPVSGGRFPIQIDAAFGDQMATLTITQTNVTTAAQAAAGAGRAAGATSGGGGLSGGAIAGIVGAAVGGGTIVAAKAVAGSRGGSSNSGDGETGGSGDTSSGPSAETLAAAGTYTLTSINGSSLPALTQPSPPNSCPGFTDTGMLVLKTSPETYQLFETSHQACPIGGSGQFNSSTIGTWSVQGGVIAFTQTDGSGFNTSAVSLAGSTVIVTFNAPHQTAGNPAVRVTATFQK